MKRKRTRENSEDEGWAVVGPEGAIEFWMMPEMRGLKLGGVETHRRTPFEYSLHKEIPDHDHCAVLDGPCWHDGTSLWASEHWIPMYEACGEEWVWLELEKTYREVFG